MIFPILKGFIWPEKAPFTYFLLAMNLLVYIATLQPLTTSENAMDEILNDQGYLVTQGSAFAVMVSQEPEKFSHLLRELARKSLDGDQESRELLGGLAVRSNIFMSRASEYDFGGDEVALKAWRVKFANLKKVEDEHPSYGWGLSVHKSSWVQFISYQFSHSGFLHLFWNMAFLLIFGCWIEVTLGSSFVILSYLGGGLLGASVFSALSGISSSPLVGASASVSAMMALVGVWGLGREKLRFFYWLLPIDGYFGFVLLPSWLVLLVSLLPDLSGYLSASEDFGSVAYAAHLGGAAFGACLAGLLMLGWLKVEYPDHDQTQPVNPGSQY